MSCCLALPAPGGEFNRICDYYCQLECEEPADAYPAKISPVALDKFEVTVSRFRAFLFAYSDATPTPRSGVNTHNDSDDGWQTEWNENLPDKEGLLAQLSVEGCGAYATFRDDGNDDLPINCVSWYVAQAFCIWDGGRLPTEAEWIYVASGGENRVYPWSDPPDNEDINEQHATYVVPSATFGLTPVGSHGQPGEGLWEHQDLAGNVAEWAWDGSLNCYGSVHCNDCGETNGGTTKVIKGGSFADDDPRWLATSARSGSQATSASQTIGIRCARDL